MKKINYFLNILMSIIFISFLGYSLFNYLDYKAKPEIYAAQSAPWYLGIQIYFFSMIIVFIIIETIKSHNQC